MATGIFNSILFSFVGPIPVDAKFSERHTRTATPSLFTLEDGTQVSDHVVRAPPRVNISFFLSSEDSIIISGGVQVGLNTAYGIKAAGLLFLLNQLWGKAIPFAVLTRHWLYRHMIITDLNAAHVVPRAGSLLCTIALQHIPVNKMENVERPPSELDDDTLIDKIGSSNYQAGTSLAYPTSNIQSYADAESAAFGDIE